MEAAAESQRRCMRQMQAPLMHLRQQRAARRSDTAAAADRQLFHAQLFVQPATVAASATQQTQLAGACIATANVAALPSFAAASASASTSAVAGWAARAVPSTGSDPSAGTGPATLHVLLSNQSGESVEVDPQWTRLAIQLRVRPLADAGGGRGGGGASDCHAATTSETELQSSFPAARWAPRSSFQTSLPIDSALLAHAHANVRLMLRIRRPEYARASVAEADTTSGESNQSAGNRSPRADLCFLSIRLTFLFPFVCLVAWALSRLRRRGTRRMDAGRARPEQSHTAPRTPGFCVLQAQAGGF